MRQINRKFDRGRELYNTAAQLFDQLRAGTKVGEIIDTGKGLFRVVDNFEKTNTAFKTAYVKRYELKPLNKTETAEYQESKLPKQQPLLQPA